MMVHANLRNRFLLVFGMLMCPTVVAAEASSDEAILLQVDEAQVSLIQNTFIATPIAGVVAGVDVSEGDHVDVGRLLVRLRADQAETELLAAESAYEAARLESENDVDQRYAVRTLEVRQQELQQSEDANRTYANTVSGTEIEKLKLVVDQSRLAIEQAEHTRKVAAAAAKEKNAAVQIAMARLNRHSIKATVSGMVTEIDVQPGEWVEAGKPIIRVISLDPLRVECFIDGRLYGSELEGHTVRFYPSGISNHAAGATSNSDALVGHVDFVASELHAVTGQVRLWATIPNPEQKVRSGMQGRLVILKTKITERDQAAQTLQSLPAKKHLVRNAQ